MTIATLTRVFKTGSTELADPDPTLTPDEVRQHWAPNFPHLATATVSEPEQKGDTLVYVFEAPQAKTKGSGESFDAAVIGAIGKISQERVRDGFAARATEYVNAMAFFTGFVEHSHPELAAALDRIQRACFPLQRSGG